MVGDQYPAIRLRSLGSFINIEIQLDETRAVSDIYSDVNGPTLFHDGAFHVLLNAFWERQDRRFVTQQTLNRPDGAWRLFVGRYLREIHKGERPPVPYGLFGAVETFLHEQPLTGDYHWLSTKVSVDEDGAVADIRLDGIRRPELEATIGHLDWIHDGRDYSLRNAIAILRTSLRV